MAERTEGPTETLNAIERMVRERISLESIGHPAGSRMAYLRAVRMMVNGRLVEIENGRADPSHGS